MATAGEQKILQESIRPGLAEVAGEQSMGGIPFGAIHVVGVLKAVYLVGMQASGRLGAIVESPVTGEERRECGRQ
jgi:hypothetical protein